MLYESENYIRGNTQPRYNKIYTFNYKLDNLI